MHKYIKHSIIKQGKFWDTKTKLEQIATSFEIVLILPKKIKTKHSYILAIKFKVRAKPAHYIIDFMNQNQEAESCIGGNQAAQTQNQSPAFNANLRLNKLNATLTLGNRPAPLLTKYFNYQKTDYYSRNYLNPEHKKS